MSANSNFDRESFQQLLASAYAIQESRIDPRFLLAVLKVQRLVNKGELAAEGAMNLVVDSARDVAGADGVAIGLLQGDQLIYRAGSGCAAAHVGGRVAASLTVSAKTKMTREILRVENAHADTRVEGAICRQFGAESLLILPLYVLPAGVTPIRGEQPLAGVLMVLFSAAHAFEDSEIRTYRLMAGLIETAVRQGRPAEQKAPSRVSAWPTVVPKDPEERAPFELPAHDAAPVFYHGNSDVIYLRCKTALTSVRKSKAFRRSSALAELAVQRTAESISSNPLRGLAVAAVVVGLCLTLWISHGDRGRTLPSASSATQGSGAGNGVRGGTVLPVEGESAEQPSTTEKRSTLAAAHVRHALPGSAEIEYIGDDVTVRHFVPRTLPQRQKASSRVAYIGDDVTVRYFTPKPAISSHTQ